MCRGGEEGRKVGAAWLGGAQSPPRVLLSETGKRGAGTEPRPFPSRHCMNQGEKREGRKVGLISLPPTPPPPAAAAAAAALRRRAARGGKWRRPRGRGRFRHTAAAAASICCVAAAASQGEGWDRGGAGRRWDPSLGRLWAGSLGSRWVSSLPPPPPLPARRRRSPQPLSRPPASGRCGLAAEGGFWGCSRS